MSYKIKKIKPQTLRQEIVYEQGKKHFISENGRRVSIYFKSKKQRDKYFDFAVKLQEKKDPYANQGKLEKVELVE